MSTKPLGQINGLEVLNGVTHYNPEFTATQLGDTSFLERFLLLVVLVIKTEVHGF
jgi:hypothetical protein